MTYNPTALCQRCAQERRFHRGENAICPDSYMDSYEAASDETSATVEELQHLIQQQARYILLQRAEIRYMAEACRLDENTPADQVREAVIKMARRRFDELGYVSAANFESYMEGHVHELTLIRDPERLWCSRGAPVPVFTQYLKHR